MVCTFWSGLGTDPQRILRGQKLLLTHPSKWGGVAPKPRDPCSAAAGLDDSLFTTVCDCNPSKTCIYIASTLSLIHFKSTTLNLLSKTSRKKISFFKKRGTHRHQSMVRKTGYKETRLIYTLHQLLMLLPAARLALTEQHWYPQTCRKASSAWHVVS